MINSLLASILSAINALLALGIILGGVGIGFAWANTDGYNQGLGIALGLVGGLLIAVMICGLLAVLLDIRAGIKEVAHLLKKHELPPHGPV
jgi:hypothetical protein